jgi:hypothetical protein
MRRREVRGGYAVCYADTGHGLHERGTITQREEFDFQVGLKIKLLIRWRLAQCDTESSGWGRSRKDSVRVSR